MEITKERKDYWKNAIKGGVESWVAFMLERTDQTTEKKFVKNVPVALLVEKTAIGPDVMPDKIYDAVKQVLLKVSLEVNDENEVKKLEILSAVDMSIPTESKSDEEGETFSQALSEIISDINKQF